MEPFTQLSGIAVPLPIDNLDTDQLMPKQFLRSIDKSGLARGLLFNMRCASDGTPKPDSVFNRPGFEHIQIIAAGPNFGCGSSREHAVWGLLQFGIRAVIAPSFGEIFYSNCFNNGLLAARVSLSDSKAILDALSTKKPQSLTINLEDCTISLTGNIAEHWSFSIAPRHRAMLLDGLDMIDATLNDQEEIRSFQQKHEAKFPWMARLPGKWRMLRDNPSV